LQCLDVILLFAVQPTPAAACHACLRAILVSACRVHFTGKLCKSACCCSEISLTLDLRSSYAWFHCRYFDVTNYTPSNQGGMTVSESAFDQLTSQVTLWLSAFLLQGTSR
jgi:hypothetical protein